jgi:hypothetical protein|tara:strand:+ start:951 stop:1187 length:237 start_codon:yes stop_codon:yes gene_type:complete
VAKVWLIVAFLINPVDDKNAFVITDPYFEDGATCLRHVSDNYLGLYVKIKQLTKAQSIGKIYCVKEDEIDKIRGVRKI